MKPQLIRGPLATLEARLAADVAAYRMRAPLAPLTVLIGSNLLRPYLRRRFAELQGGLINLHLMTMRDLASFLAVAAVQVNGTDRLPRMGDRVITEEVAEQAEGYFERVAHASGFADALDRLFQELRQADLDAVHFALAAERLSQTMPASTPKLSSLATLYTQAQRRRERFYGADDLLRLADPARLGGTELFVYGVWSLSTLQRQLLERLMEHVNVTVYLPDGHGDTNHAHAGLRSWLTKLDADEERIGIEREPDTSLAHLQARLFDAPNSGETAQDGTVRLVSAPDPPREVREAARACLRWAEEGIGFHEMAIAYRQSDPYRGLIDEIFGQGRIPLYLHDGRPLIERPVGRSLAALLSLINSRLTRAEVMEFLTETRLPDATRERYDGFEPAAWDQISRKAGIIEGRATWREKLGHERQRLKQIDTREGEPRERIASQIEEIERFCRFIDDLFPQLTGWPERDTWEDFRDRLRGLATTYIEGVEPVIDKLADLDKLQTLASDVSFVRFVRAAHGALQRIESTALFNEPAGAFGRQGVNVLDVNSLRHLRFRAVIVLGLSERAFPPPPRQDALLLDDERLKLSDLIDGEIPPRERGPSPEPLQFTLAVAAARERLLLSYAPGDASGSRSQLPSYFFRAAAETLTGETVTIAGIDSLPPKVFERVPANRFGAATPSEALTTGEYDRTLIATFPELGKACLMRRAASFARACQSWEARWHTDALTAWDGVLSVDGALAITRYQRSISPTRLEAYATCPYRYFLQSVLHLEEVEEPETIERLSALNRGSIIHDILDRFLSRHSADLASGEMEHTDLQSALHEFAEERCREAETLGQGGYALVWEFDKAAIFEDLDNWLELEIQEQRHSELRPRAFEVRFGRSWFNEGQTGNGYSVDEPLTVTFDGSSLTFHGRIDRIDWNDDATTFRVIDYKTGRASKGDDQFTQGKTLQLPIYLLAAAHALRQHGVDIAWEQGRTEYFFPTRRGEFKRVHFSGSTLARRWADFEQLMGDLTGQIARGDFHPEPGNKAENCRFCLGREVCDQRISRLAERKAGSREERFLRIQGVE